ncbi:MAG: hypothetical protein JST73_11980 [Actinobacteria bacterium]|nr:hypothetical protein [Actinomycetota bacterium]
MNRDTIAYRKFIGWWWPLEAPLREERPVGEGVSPQRARANAGQWGIGSPYLRLWMLLGAIAASAVFMGSFIASGAAENQGEIVSKDLLAGGMWIFVNALLWLGLASRRYGFRVAAPLCAVGFGVLLYYFTYWWFPLTFVLLVSPIFTRTPPRTPKARRIASVGLIACPFIPTVMYILWTPFR